MPTEQDEFWSAYLAQLRRQPEFYIGYERLYVPVPLGGVLQPVDDTRIEQQHEAERDSKEDDSHS